MGLLDTIKKMLGLGGENEPSTTEKAQTEASTENSSESAPAEEAASEEKTETAQ